jgi:hypothetical protein
LDDFEPTELFQGLYVPKQLQSRTFIAPRGGLAVPTVAESTPAASKSCAACREKLSVSAFLPRKFSDDPLSGRYKKCA